MLGASHSTQAVFATEDRHALNLRNALMEKDKDSITKNASDVIYILLPAEPDPIRC